MVNTSDQAVEALLLYCIFSVSQLPPVSSLRNICFNGFVDDRRCFCADNVVTSDVRRLCSRFSTVQIRTRVHLSFFLFQVTALPFIIYFALSDARLLITQSYL